MLTHEVARRLEQKLGLGQFPLVRRRLYARLQRLCETKGEPVLLIVAAVVEEAMGPKVRDKGQYFCWVVKRRLEEAGYWQPGDPGPNQTREQAHQVAATVARVADPPATVPDNAVQAELERLRLSNELLRRERDSLFAERGRGKW